MSMFARSAAILSLAASALAQAPMPGSALVFPSIRQDASTLTLVSVTNSDEAPSVVPGFGNDIMAYFNYVIADVDPTDPFRPTSCRHFCRPEYLTPADTVTVSVGCHVPGPETRGYLVVHAVSAVTGGAVSHNHLLGSIEIFDFLRQSIFNYVAVPFCAIPADGALTDVNRNGRLDFDGVEYAQMHRDLYVDSFFAAGNSRLALAEFACLPDGAEISLNLAIWNDNERALSLHFPFRCWFETELDQISVLFTEQWLRGVANDPGELDLNCDGIQDFETGWFRISASQARLGTQVEPNPALLGVLLGGPRSCHDGRLLWGSKERRNGCF